MAFFTVVLKVALWTRTFPRERCITCRPSRTFSRERSLTINVPLRTVTRFRRALTEHQPSAWRMNKATQYDKAQQTTERLHHAVEQTYFKHVYYRTLAYYSYCQPQYFRD